MQICAAMTCSCDFHIYDTAKKIRICHYYVCVLDYGVVLLINFQDASKKQAEEKVLVWKRQQKRFKYGKLTERSSYLLVKSFAPYYPIEVILNVCMSQPVAITRVPPTDLAQNVLEGN